MRNIRRVGSFIALWATFALLALSATACAHAQTPDDTSHLGATAHLTVDNQRFDRVVVYLGRAGYAGVRLGDVSAGGVRVFYLSGAHAPVGSAIRLYARVFASDAFYYSDEIWLLPGRTNMRWRLMPGETDALTLVR